MSVGVTMAATSKYDVARQLLSEAEVLDNEAVELYKRIAKLHEQAEAKQAEAAELNQKAQGVLSGEYEVSEALHRLSQNSSRNADVEVDSSPVLTVADESDDSVTVDDEALPAIIEGMEDVVAEALIHEVGDDVSDSGAVEVVFEEMTDEHADVLPFGNDFPRPSLPIKTHEVAKLHIPYLDQIDGARFTPDEVERFCTSRVKRGSDVVDRYMCVCCTTDENNPVDHLSRDIKWFAGVTVCVKCSHRILKWLNQAQEKTRFMLRGTEATGFAKAHWLHGAFKHFSLNPYPNTSVQAEMRDASLKREAEILAKLRSQKASPKKKVETAVHTGQVIDLNPDPRFDDVEDSSPALPASFKGSSGPRSTLNQISEGVEFFAAEGDEGVPHPSQEELDAAVSENDFLQMLFPLWGFRKRLKRSLVNEALYKASEAYQSATRSISHVHRVWEGRNPASHEYWRKKMNLRTLVLKKSLTPFELKERAELEKDKKLSAEVAQMISGMSKQRSDENESALDAKVQSNRAKSIRRKSKDRRSAEDVAWLANYDEERKAEDEAASARAAKEKARKERQAERAEGSRGRKGAGKGGK